MNTPYRSPSPRSGFVFDTRELGRRAGAMKRVSRTVEAPDGLGSDVVGVRAGSPIELDVMLESVIEGVLVTGTAQLTMAAQCVRCLTELDEDFAIDVQELYVHPGSEASEDEVSRLVNELLDLEPLIRDEVVLALPFQPLCRDDCAGLCPDCGADLNADLEHRHEAALDSRWAALTAVRPPGSDAAEHDVASATTEPGVREEPTGGRPGTSPYDMSGSEGVR